MHSRSFPRPFVCKLASYFTSEIERQISISKESTVTLGLFGIPGRRNILKKDERIIDWRTKMTRNDNGHFICPEVKCSWQRMDGWICFYSETPILEMPTENKIRKYKCGLMSNKRCNFESWNNRFQWNGTSFIWSADCATQLQTKQSLKLCGWQHKGGIETLWIYYNIMVQLCLLSQSFILCFKTSTVIFPLPFSSTSVVQMDYLTQATMAALRPSLRSFLWRWSRTLHGCSTRPLPTKGLQSSWEAPLTGEGHPPVYSTPAGF